MNKICPKLRCYHYLHGFKLHIVLIGTIFDRDYKHLHKLNYNFKSSDIDEEFKKKLQDYFKKEYEIYNHLIEISKKINKR